MRAAGAAMLARLRDPRPVLTLVTGVLAALALACSVLAIGYQKQLSEASRYNFAFDYSQLGTEALRFQLAVANENGKEAALRYGILLSRLKTIETVRLVYGVPSDGALADFLANVPRLQPLVDALPDAAAAAVIHDRTASLVRPVLRLASHAHAKAGDEVMILQGKLRRIFAAVCAVTLTLVLSGAALIFLVFRQNRHLDRVVRTDALTGVANRFAFKALLDETGEKDVALVLADIDHFKAFNDTLGHPAGDGLIREVSRRLREAAGSGAAIARIGGDEFALLFTGADAETRGAAACETALAAINRPFEIGGRQVRATVSLGLAVAGDDGPATLFNDADIALDSAKAAGRDCWMQFQAEMKRDFLRRQHLREELRGAIARREMFLMFQPIVDLATRRTVGFEALLRWQHPELGMVSPVEFVPVAEETGAIVEIGRWVVAEACRQAAFWPEPAFVTVNVSARQLADATFAAHVRACLLEHGLSSGRLVLELTETALVENDTVALDVLHTLRGDGCRVALDDFGTGYASLSYLWRFPLDKLKIDRSFLADAEKGLADAEKSNNAAIISMIAALAGRLDLETVAEGVESEEHCLLLERAGCKLGQGYYFARPLLPGACVARLAEEMTTAAPLGAAA